MINWSAIYDAKSLHVELMGCLPRIEINSLVNYAGSLLNRDKSNFAKRINFGGVDRVRISSQCLKYAIRRAKVDSDTWNTRYMGNLVCEEIKRREPSVTDEYLEGVDAIVRQQLTPKDGEKEKKDHMFKVSKYDVADFADAILAEFPINLPIDKNEIMYDRKDAKKRAKTAGGRVYDRLMETVATRPISSEIAMFGRMSTATMLRSVDGAVCVNHAFTTNAMSGDIDEFTAVDEWQNGEELGAGMLGDTDINAGCFYKYVSINVLTVVENLMQGVDYTDVDEMKRRLKVAIDAVIEFIQLYAITAPEAKQTSMATYASPACMYITAGVRVANCSYENAFSIPARAHGDVDIITDSVNKLVYSIDNDLFNLNEYDKRIWIGQDMYKKPNGVVVESLRDALDDVRGYLYGTCN